MKNYLPYVIVIVLGMVIGWLCRDYHFRDATKMYQRDTTIVYERIPYSKIELTRNTYKLDVPEISRARLVYIPADSVTYIYRDSIRYVTLPREFYYTKLQDVEIWHSGIDSTIDSLNVVRKTTNITNTIQKKPKKNSVSIGIEATYTDAFRMPLQAQYAHKIAPWLSVYGYAEYEVFTRQMGVGLGTNLQLEW